MFNAKKLMAGVAVVGALAFSAEANAIPVSLELVLAVDVSGSVSGSEFALQRTGYVNAFNDPGIQAAITALGGSAASGGIGVSLVYWSSGQVQSVAMTHVYDAASAGAFATAVSLAGRPGGIGNNTGIAGAIGFSDASFDSNGFEGIVAWLRYNRQPCCRDRA